MTKEQTTRFVNWLKENRAERGITQQFMAKCLNASQSMVSKWENGERKPGYIPHALRYFFDTWEKNPLRKCNLDEIPSKPTLATGKWLTWWMDTEGVTVAELADFLGVTSSTVRNWKKPETKISIVVEYAIRQAMKTLAK